MVGHAYLAGANGSWGDCFGAGGVYPKNSLHTVDGRNPGNQLIGSLPQIFLQDFPTPRWLAGRRISEASTVG